MTKTYPVTKETRAASLQAALRVRRPVLRFTHGMAAAAKKQEQAADKGKQRT